MKRALVALFYLFCSACGGFEALVRQNATAFWTRAARPKGQNSSEAVLINPSWRLPINYQTPATRCRRFRYSIQAFNMRSSFSAQ